MQSAFAYKLNQYSCLNGDCHVNVKEPKEPETEPAITIYPNPTNDKLQLKKTKIKIYNIVGSLVYQSSIKNFQSEIQIDVSFLQKGIYIIDIENITKKKIIVN